MDDSFDVLNLIHDAALVTLVSVVEPFAVMYVLADEELVDLEVVNRSDEWLMEVAA